ncbi:MAG: Ig-like domain-containing protein [Terriglobales bacterium]
MVTIYSVPSARTEKNSISLCFLLMIAFVLCALLVSASFAQIAIPTSRSDNQRTGSNVNETILTPSNVNKNQFGFLFNYAIDYQALAQPLYMPNVTINGQSHNVVYVATMADSVYAFDADSNTGLNASSLWSVNFTDPANGITTASGSYLPCSGGKTTGFTQEGIAGTPTIDTTTGTMYLVAKTLENGTVIHRLHALDITNGQEKFGGPIQIAASSTATGSVNTGKITTFNSLHQLNRPGLLLSNGVVYIGFGSNSCNDGNSGWVLAYDETSLQQLGSFNTSPDLGLTSIWQSGNGLAADEFGNIFVATAESSNYNVPMGGQSYCHTVLELTPNPALQNSLVLTGYFTPDDVAYLNAHDLDLSSGGPMVLPDQEGAPAPHLVVAAGKQGNIYVLNRDDMGMYNSNDGQLSPSPGGTGGQELDAAVGHMFSSPAYWNGMVYYAGNADEVKAFALTGTYPPLSPTPVVASHQVLPGSHSPSISSNGNNNGVLWVMSGGSLYAFNATTLVELYSTNMNKTRDALPPVAHFATQTIDNGKVYVATQTTLQVYGLLQSLNLVSGGNQSAPILTTLPAPIQVQVADPYSGVGISGVTVTFGDGNKGGTLNPVSAVSDSNGNVSTTYTFPKTAGTYTLTASSANAAALSIPETALPGPAIKLIAHSGNKQTGQAGSILPTQLNAEVEDAYGNGVPGATVTFVDQSGGGTLIPPSVATNSKGFALVSYQIPNADGTFKIVASTTGLKTATFNEYATGDIPGNLLVVSGDNQTAPVNTTLPQPLVVQVVDQGGSPIPGVSVLFSAPSGIFAGSPATTNSNGQASVTYTTGSSAGTVTVTAAVNGVNTTLTVFATQ